MLTSLLLTAALASPDTPEELPRLDVSAFMDELVILDDGSGHQIAYRASAPRESIWYGEKGSFYQLEVYSSSSNGDTTWSVGATDRRVWDGVGVLRKGDEYSMTCGSLSASLTRLPANSARSVLKKAKFYGSRWQRPYVGAWRDEWGVYYFVDRSSAGEEVDHRVYIGWRGQMLRAPMRLVASDTLGRVYSGNNGTRRLIITNGAATYIQDDERRALYALDYGRDRELLYTGLGLYADAPHGTPCDALLTPAE